MGQENRFRIFVLSILACVFSAPAGLDATFACQLGAIADPQEQAEKEPAGKRPRPSKQLREFETKYGLEVVTEKPKFPVRLAGKFITGKAATEIEVIRYLPLLLDEFGIYPASFVKESDLVKIVLCKELAWAGQRRAAVPDFRRKTLYYDCEKGKSSKFYQRIVIHHEFFHMVDYSDDGLVYQDDEWKKLNPPDFRYGNGGASVQGDHSQSGYRQKTNGFITRYSTSGLEEDKAEIFAHSIVNPEKIESVAKQDDIFDRKVMRIRVLVKNVSGDMNDQFWRTVRQFRRPRQPAQPSSSKGKSAPINQIRIDGPMNSVVQ